MITQKKGYQLILTDEDENKYPYNNGRIYPIIYKVVRKYPSIFNNVYCYLKLIFIKFGKFYFQFIRKTNVNTKVFLFFPWNITGGSDKVNYEITHLLSSYNPVVFFTDRIEKEKLKNNYPTDITIVNCSERYIKYLHIFQQFFYAGYLSEMINEAILSSKEPILLLGSNSFLFYEIIAAIKQSCKIIDVLHAFIGIEKVSLSSVPKISHRILITPNLYPKLESQYQKFGYSEYLDRVTIILNGVEISESINNKPQNLELKIIYVGRESPEKRTYLIGKIATRCNQNGIKAEFQLIGVSSSAVNPEDVQNCNIRGEITDREELESVYSKADILLITSSFEGFPMVIMEGMGHGVLPISTDVGGVKDHIINGETGYCVNNTSEEQIISEIVQCITLLSQDRKLLGSIQSNAYDYAKEHFSIELFRKKYLDLIQGLLTQIYVKTRTQIKTVN